MIRDNRIRKTVTGIVVSIVLAFVSLSPAQAPLELYLDLNQGDSYLCFMEMTRNVVQTIDDADQQLNQSISIYWHYEVMNRDSDGIMALRMTYERIRILQDFGFQKAEYDSDNPPSYIEPSLRGYGALIGAELQVGIDPKGNVLALSGADILSDRVISSLKIPDSQNKERIISEIRRQFGEEALRGAIQQITSFYPLKPVAIGDSWEFETAAAASGFPMRTVSHYTLVSRNNGIAEIAVESDITSDPEEGRIEMGEFSVAYDIAGGQRGTIKVDERSGLPMSSEIEMEFEGTVTGSGTRDRQTRSWPIKSDGRALVTFEKR